MDHDTSLLESSEDTQCLTDTDDEGQLIKQAVLLRRNQESNLGLLDMDDGQSLGSTKGPQISDAQHRGPGAGISAGTGPASSSSRPSSGSEPAVRPVTRHGLKPAPRRPAGREQILTLRSRVTNSLYEIAVVCLTSICTGAITMRSLIQAGILIPGEHAVCVEYKGNCTWGDLNLEGQIECGGKSGRVRR
jgi:hypothetical protein